MSQNLSYLFYSILLYSTLFPFLLPHSILFPFPPLLSFLHSPFPSFSLPPSFFYTTLDPNHSCARRVFRVFPANPPPTYQAFNFHLKHISSSNLSPSLGKNSFLKYFPMTTLGLPPARSAGQAPTPGCYLSKHGHTSGPLSHFVTFPLSKHPNQALLPPAARS